METLECIFSRRSIRKYKKDEPIPEDKVEILLKAAMQAPSAGNQQPWEFIVINDRKILDEIPNYHPYSAMLKEAPLAIMVCGNLDLEKHKGYWVQDCSAATQNLLLAAHDLGLGAVWIGLYPREDRIKKIKELLNIPENIIPLSLIALGIPNEKKEKEDRFNKNKIRYNKWK